MAQQETRTQEDTSAVHVWLIIMKAHQAFEKHAQRSIEATGLCFSDFQALEYLLHKGTFPINALAEHLSLTSGALTAVVDRLEKKHLLARSLDATDRRVRNIQLTEAGKTLIESVFRKHQADMENAMANLDSTERLHLIQLLKKAGKAAANQLETGMTRS